MWFESLTGVPTPAICTQENVNTISCSVVHRDVLNLDPKDGVRYTGDPGLPPDATSPDGFWAPMSSYKWPDPYAALEEKE